MFCTQQFCIYESSRSIKFRMQPKTKGGSLSINASRMLHFRTEKELLDEAKVMMKRLIKLFGEMPGTCFPFTNVANLTTLENSRLAALE